MTSGIAFDRPDRLSRLRAFPYDRFKIYMIVPIVRIELNSIQAIEVVSVVRVVCDRLGSVSIWSSRSSEHFLRRLGRSGRSGRSYGNQGRDPFNQNVRKFRSKTQWIGSIQPEKFRKNGSTFWVGPVGILVDWIGPKGSSARAWKLSPTRPTAPAIQVQISVGPHPSCFFLHGLYACEKGFIDNQTIINKLLLQDRT